MVPTTAPNSSCKRSAQLLEHKTLVAQVARHLRARTQAVWDRFYSLPRIWNRSRCTPTLRARLAFVLISKLYRQMYANTGIATDSARVSRANRWARLIARPCRRLFVARPLPNLGVLARDGDGPGARGAAGDCVSG